MHILKSEKKSQIVASTQLWSDPHSSISQKVKSNFGVLFNEITKREPLLATNLKVHVYRTYGEQPITNATSEAFPFTVQLRRANHLKDNITDHLHKMLIPDVVVDDVLRDMFGTSSEKGLIHTIAREFNAKLSVLEKLGRYWRSSMILVPLKYSSGFGYM